MIDTKKITEELTRAQKDFRTLTGNLEKMRNDLSSITRKTKEAENDVTKATEELAKKKLKFEALKKDQDALTTKVNESDARRLDYDKKIKSLQASLEQMARELTKKK